MLHRKVHPLNFCSKETELHVLFNNAGVMSPPIEQVTVDGYDMQFGTNVLGKISFSSRPNAQLYVWSGHFYFTKLLLPTLIATAKTSPDGKARVVNTSSLMHMFGGLDFNTFKDGPARKKRDGAYLYEQSKRVRQVFWPPFWWELTWNRGMLSTPRKWHAGMVTKGSFLPL
jgi:NAD(P)-dependent dehydrogenase (short-subunit alcohol dehydrogenase family)